MSYQCAICEQMGCRVGDLTKTMSCCPSKDSAIQEEAKKLYLEPENQHIAKTAAIVEHEGYGQMCRLEEIMLFARRAGYQKIGLVFCVGLKGEAKEVHKILTYNGFDVVSIICKNGAVPKSHVGITAEQTLSGCAEEVMCNPIGQALLMNEAEVDFVILLGLCVGHDTLALKYLKAPVTVLAVKDRVTGHNPLAAVYTAESYFRKKFFPPKK